jgi:hypothetical protein
MRRQNEHDGRVLEALWTRLYLAEAIVSAAYASLVSRTIRAPSAQERL